MLESGGIYSKHSDRWSLFLVGLLVTNGLGYNSFDSILILVTFK